MVIGAKVWISLGPKSDTCFVSGTIESVGNGLMVDVRTSPAEDGVQTVDAKELLLSSSKAEMPSDVCRLEPSAINEATILKCVEGRWKEGKPYTWIGPVLLSVNLFRSAPPATLTSDATQQRYADSPTPSSSPPLRLLFASPSPPLRLPFATP